MTPREVYQARGDALAVEAGRWARRDRRLSNARLAVFAAGAADAVAVFGLERLPAWTLALPVVAFVALVLVHDRAIRRRERAERAGDWYARGLARLEHRFAGTGTAGDERLDRDHPYAADLDLFGRGSLFELLCGARTRAGEDTLAAWLLAPATLPELHARQQAVRELTPALELREDLALLGEHVRVQLEPGPLSAWSEAPPVGLHRSHRLAAALLAALALGALALWLLGSAGPLPFVVAVAAEGAFAFRLRPRVTAVMRSVETPTRELRALEALLGRIEAESFTCERLSALRAALDTDGVPPSRCIAGLRRRVELLDARRNQLFAPVAALLLWGVQGAAAVEAWRLRVGPAVAVWLRAVGELEALLSLAGHAFERPDHVFPELLEKGPTLEGVGLGHPLLPEARCVRNDLRLHGGLQVLVVSGSNMSGKSTWLRTVGTNAVLALAGGVVCAERLRCSPLSVGACIRVTDSLQEGDSRFYAEIKRVRQVLELAEGPLPALFLLDEIFHGTNSHDRGIGAEAVLRALAERGAVGLVTTHDLALAEVATRLAPRAENVHFADHLEGDRMVFDYRVQPGVVSHSNALALMRAVGLPV